MSTDLTFLQTMGISLTLLQERQMKWYITDLHIYLCYNLSKQKGFTRERNMRRTPRHISNGKHTRVIYLFVCVLCLF